MKKATKKTPAKKLTEPEKQKLRIAVAKDVLKVLKSNTIIPTTGKYVHLDYDTRELKYKKMAGKTSQQQATIAQKECQVCGIGAVFLSLVKIDNKYDLAKNLKKRSGCLQDKDVLPRLREVFSNRQIALIEIAFEGSNRTYADKDELSLAAEDLAVDFYREWEESDYRLQAIMENVVKNKGLFLPVSIEDFV